MLFRSGIEELKFRLYSTHKKIRLAQAIPTPSPATFMKEKLLPFIKFRQAVLT
jgi:hypothetical protein